MARLSVIPDAACKGRILDTAASVTKPSNGSVVAEALELVLHSLGEHRALDIRVLRRFRGEDWINVVRVKRVRHARFECRLVLALQKLTPIHGVEEWVRFDFGGAIGTETLVGISVQKLGEQILGGRWYNVGSDTSTHGGFSVLRKHATECLPALDMTQATPTQELVTRDLHGFEWRFKHIFRGQPRRHLLTTGWSTFVSSKRLVAGDAFVFLRGENGDLRVGVRRLARHQSTMPTSVISSQSMHLGVLATASHAVRTTTIFVVFYKPRISQFIVGVNKYMEAIKHGFSLGTRFRMRFEGEESPERIFTGTIVGTGDLSSQWPASKWRSLQVQWDEPTTVQRPDKVSPWEIEPFLATSPISTPAQQPQLKCKRSRPTEPSVITPAPPSFLYSLPQSQDSINASLKLFQDPSLERNSGGYSSNNSFKPETPPPPPRPTNCSYRLFGFDLTSNPPAPLPQDKQPMDTCGAAKCQEPITPTSMNEQKKQQTSRSRTKVQMQGIAVGRAVDLTLLKSYDELIEELEEMFEIQGQLRPRDKWIVVFTDDEGDMMLAGDDPWNEFCKMAKKIFIYSSDEVKKMATKLKISSSLENEEYGNE